MNRWITKHLVRGHSITTWTEFYRIFTNYPPRVEILYYLPFVHMTKCVLSTSSFPHSVGFTIYNPVLLATSNDKNWFGFSEKATKFEKIFFVLLTRASCSVRATAYLSKSRQRFFQNKCGQVVLYKL